MNPEVKITGNKLEITYIFDAPRPAVFDWWSKAEKLQQWSGCKEATLCEVKMDFRIGGGFTQKMQIADKGDFTITGKYEEIVIPEKIAYTANLGPAITRVTVEFFAQGKQTKVVLKHEGLPDETICKIVSQGTMESLEKLESLLVGVTAATQL